MKSGQPTGIIKCMPLKFIYEEYGYSRFLRDFVLRLNNEDGSCFLFTLSSIPKYDVLHFYLLFGGKIQYRANIAKIEGPRSITFPGRSTINGRAWAWLSGPVLEAPREILMKGFQGFRYTEELF